MNAPKVIPPEMTVTFIAITLAVGLIAVWTTRESQTGENQ